MASSMKRLVPVVAVIAAVACFAVGLAVPWIKTTAIVGLCYALAALGVTVLLRAGQISFGHALYALIGGYAVGFIGRAFPTLDGLALIVAGTLVATIAGALIGFFVVRYRGIFFGMLNLAISMVFFSLASKLFALTGGSDGLRIARPTLAGIEFDRGGFETAMLALTLVAALGLGWFVQRYFSSAAGEALAGVKTNETRLEYLGLSSYRILWNGYVLSAGLVGLSGALFAVVQGLVTPELGYWLRSGEYVFIAILGGASHVMGAFVGTLIFEVVKLIAGAFFTGVWQMMLGAVLIVVILVAPNGIVGLFKARRAALPEGAR